MRLPAEQTSPWLPKMPDAAAGDGGGQVGVGEHDVGALAPELQRHPLQGVGAGPHDVLTDLLRAGEADLVDLGVLQQGLAGVGAEAGEDVEHPGGHARLVGDPGQAEGGEGGLLGGLEDDGAARREGGRDLLAGHEQGVVPGHDQAADPDRLLDDEAHGIGADGRDVAADLGGPARVVLEHERRFLDVPDGVLVGLARVVGLQLGQLRRVPAQDGGHLEQQVGPIPFGDRDAPGAVVERPPGGSHRPVGVLGRAGRDGGQHLAGRGVDGVEAGAVGGVRPLPVEVHLLGVSHRSLHLWWSGPVPVARPAAA